MPQKPFDWITGRSYGPIVGETSHDTNFGPRGNALGTYDVALSPDLLKSHPLGSTFTYGGNTYTVGDVSYRSPGNPNANTIEFRDTQDPGRINAGDIQWNAAGSGGSGGPMFFRFDQNTPAWEWNPKEGGILGKIGARMPGASTYLLGQSIFDFIRGGLGKLFPGQQQQGAADTPGGIPDNLQPTSPGYSFAPGSGPPGDPNAPAPYQPPPWVMPPTQEFGGPGFGAYAQAQNAFIPSLIAWNGPGQANPTGREPGLFEDASAKWLASHNVGAGWWNPGRGGGRGGGGPMPVNFQ
jgi:hypothetical protein